MKFDKWDMLIYLGVLILLTYYTGYECHNIEQFSERNRLQLGINYYIYQSVNVFSLVGSVVLFLKIYQIPFHAKKHDNQNQQEHKNQDC